ncbi:hypothetical protein PMI07_005970 [Rhizobium sp. CF080]|uniref:efflux RND transporter permease subunit n=1 Tax=Rhizobium sp. (strain CF080) TaxID=1144310 RepID=UPI0002715E32|nr:efflux RND transporter permease subunit [Rhizobium sp. CF080]EUB99689.1 hypothetical protein PMI07_005970 [Rhizobium sp. CF080]
MESFNLSDWALRHRSLVICLMIAAALAGPFSYSRLGREEDPAFTTGKRPDISDGFLS